MSWLGNLSCLVTIRYSNYGKTTVSRSPSVRRWKSCHRRSMSKTMKKRKCKSNLARATPLTKISTKQFSKLERMRKRSSSSSKQFLTNKELTSKLVEVRRQLKQLEDQHSKLKGTYKPRLDETKNHQGDIVKEVRKLREDSAMLPEMFRELVANNENL